MPTSTAKPRPKLASARLEFETLLAKVAEARRHRARWEASAARLRDMGRRVLDPLEEQFSVYARQLIQVFHQAYDHRALTDPERLQLAESICILARRMLGREDDSEIRQLYDQYSGSSYEVDRQHFGMQLREIGGMLLDQTYPVSYPFDEEAELEESEELHAKLVGTILTLSPEQQPCLLEHANVGYVNGDVIPLRMLEVELEQIARPGAAHLGIRQLNKRIGIAEDYLADLEFDTVGIQFSLMVQLNLPGDPDITEHIARQCVRMQQHLLEHQLENIACDAVDFRDITKLKAWIKEKQDAEGAAPLHH